MHNTLKVFFRDLRRLFTTPAALVIIFGITVLPALYSWVNIYGFWDPYNHTNAITISVANDDQGGSNPMTGELNAGDNIVEALSQNDQLGWKFCDHDQALQDVQSGSSYAAFVIPEDFTSDLLTILTTDFQEPQLEYYVNEKISAIAPRVTDTGATTVDEQINDTFVATVAKVVSDDLSSAFAQANTKLNDADTAATDALRGAVDKVTAAQGKLTDLTNDIDSQHSKIATVRTTIGDLTNEVDALNSQVSTIVSTTDATRLSLSSFALGLASPLDTASRDVTSAAGTASLTMQTANSKYAQMNGQITTGIDTAQGLADAEQSLIDTLSSSSLASRQEVKDQIAKLQSEHDKTQQQLDALKQAQQDSTKTMNDTTALVTNLSNDTTSAITSLDAMRATLMGTTLPQINTSFSTLSSALSSMSSLATSQAREVKQIYTILDQLDSTLTQMQSVLSTTNDALGTLKTDLDTATTDVGLLANSTTWHNIVNAMDLDSGKISDFMSSPTKIETEKLYPVQTYGSAMAALFTSLTMWIGGLACVIIMRTDADDEGVPGMTIRQGYMGKYLLLSTVTILQAITVSIGEVVLKVQMVNIPMFFVTSLIVGLVFLAFIYALAVCFAHIGVGVAMVLAFLQIPGSSGLYPIEMMPSFFQHIYPLLPFTYSINMYRECIAGFYKAAYWVNLGKLLIFAVIAFVFGLLVRPYMTNLTRVFNREALESHLVVADETPTVARRYRLMQLIRAVGSSETYRTDVMLSATRYELRYPKLKRGALIAGFVIPAILAVLSHYNTSNKPLVVALWVGWMIIIIVFLLAIDLIRDSFQRQMLLLKVSPDELRQMLREHRATLLRKRQFANNTPSPLPQEAGADSDADTAATEPIEPLDGNDGDDGDTSDNADDDSNSMGDGSDSAADSGAAHDDADDATSSGINNGLSSTSGKAATAAASETPVASAAPVAPAASESSAASQSKPAQTDDTDAADTDAITPATASSAPVVSPYEQHRESAGSGNGSGATTPRHAEPGTDALASSLAAPLEKLNEAILQRKDNLQLKQESQWEDDLIARFTQSPDDDTNDGSSTTADGNGDAENESLSAEEQEARSAMEKHQAVKELAQSLNPSIAQSILAAPILPGAQPARYSATGFPTPEGTHGSPTDGENSQGTDSTDGSATSGASTRKGSGNSTDGQGATDTTDSSTIPTDDTHTGDTHTDKEGMR